MSSTRNARQSHRRARGQGLVEFAVVAPVLIALVFGVFDFGRAMSANVTVTNSSREGARYIIANVASAGSASYSSCQSSSGATAPTSSTGEGAAWRQLRSASLDVTQLSMNVYFYKSTNDPSNDSSSNHASANLSVSCPVGSNGTPTTAGSYTPVSGDWVVFVTSYTYHPVTPLISSMLSTVTVTQATTMVIE